VCTNEHIKTFKSRWLNITKLHNIVWKMAFYVSEIYLVWRSFAVVAKMFRDLSFSGHSVVCIPLEKNSIVNYRKNTLGFSLEYTLVLLLQ